MRSWQQYQHRSSLIFLISAHDIDLNDRETLTEINQINPTLELAIAHDIASGEQAVAEVMDANLGNRDAGDVAQDKVTLVVAEPNQRGRDAVDVVSANEFGKLSRPRGSLVDFFRNSPLAGVKLDLARSTDTGRRVDL